MSDPDRWLPGVRRLDPESLGAVYDALSPALFRYAFRLLGDGRTAEDVVAETFSRLLAAIRNGGGPQVYLGAYLYRIAHNLTANWHRDSHRRREVPLDDHTHTIRHGEQPEAALVKNEEIEGLLESIRRLPDDRQNLLILKFVERMSNEEIAHIMGRSEGAIKSLYHRTLLSLRDDLGKSKGD